MEDDVDLFPSAERVIALALIHLIPVNNGLIIDCDNHKFLISHTPAFINVENITDDFELNHFEHGQTITFHDNEDAARSIALLNNEDFIPLKKTFN